MNYKDTPQKIIKILELFDKNNLIYILFKCEHIFNGENKNLDILFLDNKEYFLASKILEKQGFVLYLPEKIEKYKKMYLKFDGKELTAIHLHREIAWHGVVVLDKKKVLARSKDNLPSVEDSLLIHSAHALFENFKVSEVQKELLKQYKIKIIEWGYLNSQLQRYGWKEPFYSFIKNDFSINKKLILSAYLFCLLKNPFNSYNLSQKIFNSFLRKISLKRKGYLISLIGANGTGKSSIKKALLSAYTPLTDFVHGNFGYYFGWKSSSLSKKISSILPSKFKKKKTFKNASKEIKSFNLFQELLFGYVYLSFILRYLKYIYPKLRENKLVVTDRYFYDLYGQYPYSKNSIILKILPFPKPDKLFILNADVNVIMERGKCDEEKRKIQPKEKLEGQRKRYLTLAKDLRATIIDTEIDLEINVKKIINDTWKEYC